MESLYYCTTSNPGKINNIAVVCHSEKEEEEEERREKDFVYIRYLLLKDMHNQIIWKVKCKSKVVPVLN
jgi:hypothetical protein